MANIREFNDKRKFLKRDEYVSKENSSLISKRNFVLFLVLSILLFIVFLIIFVILFRTEAHFFIDLVLSVGLFLVFIIVSSIAFAGSKKGYESNLVLLKVSPSNFKVVDNFSEVSNAVVEQSFGDQSNDFVLDNKGEKIYYAEELFDDEEDLFTSNVNSRMIEKAKHKTFKEIASGIDASFESLGYQGSIGERIISSMLFSRLILFKNKEYLSVLFKVNSTPETILHASKGSSISNESLLVNALNYAKNNPDKPVFVGVDELNQDNFSDYLRSLYPYFDNPQGNSFISNQGLSIRIPNNVYFIASLSDNALIYDVPRKYLRYISYVYQDLKKVNPSSNPVNYPLSLQDINIALKDAIEDGFAISEESWKVLDSMVNLCFKVNGYAIQNKIARGFEDATTMMLSTGIEELDVMDMVVSSNIILCAIISSDINKFRDEANLVNFFDDEYGEDKMLFTKKFIKEYLALFDKKGERLNAK